MGERFEKCEKGGMGAGPRWVCDATLQEGAADATGRRRKAAASVEERVETRKQEVTVREDVVQYTEVQVPKHVDVLREFERLHQIPVSEERFEDVPVELVQIVEVADTLVREVPLVEERIAPVSEREETVTRVVELR